MQRMLTVAALVSLALPATVHAAVTEPPVPPATTGEAVPKPVPDGELSIATSRGFTTADLTWNGLFKSRGENLDYLKDAQTTPGTFSPQCGFTGELVMRGGGCKVGLGWYNATEGATTPPPQNQIYPLVPATFPMCPMPPMTIDPTMACCADNDFCPMATKNTTQAPQHQWNMLPYSADNIQADPRYKGGLIGFVLMGATSGDGRCNQNKYSQIDLNEKSPSGKPWIGAIVYQSTMDPNSYYLGFEDQATSPTSWHGMTNASDGDFNDFIFYISGITCKGGGKPCDTGMKGVCANGVTQCSNGEDITCKPIVPSSAEVCDGLDNDCDGVIDQQAHCDNDFVCDHGKCVGKCGTSEFPCAPGLQCDNGYCKDPSCIGVDCPVGQVCVNGKCEGGCDGVKCPRGRSCVAGECVDLCDGVKCMTGRVCENGVCIASCDCQGCPTGQVCGADHHCVDPGCEKQTCNPPATVCVAGKCQDNCEGVTCSAQHACENGVCVRKASAGTGGFTGVLVDAGATGGSISGGSGSGGRPGGSPFDASGSGNSGAPNAAPGISTCTCTTAFGAGAEGPLAASLVLALALLGRRRRRPGA